MNDVVLAGDLGGTNLRVAAVDSKGNIVARAEAETPRGQDESRILAATIELAERCSGITGRQPIAFGFAIPAIMSSAEGLIFSSPNLPELDERDLRGPLSRSLGLRVVLENDANAAAVGEHWLGASKGYSSSVCVTLGTGVGGGLIIDGKLLRGPDGTAGELGHICVEPLGPPCGCGSNGCLEQYSSATAMVRIARELAVNFPAAGWTEDVCLDALAIHEHASEGDPLAKEVFRLAGAYLGLALAGLINVLNPEAIVIGGGVAQGWELFVGSVKTEIGKRAFREPAERARIFRASLGNDSGLIGAALLAFNAAKADDVPTANDSIT